jgi:hypothetical protein
MQVDGAHIRRPGSVYAAALTHVPPGRLSECGGEALQDVPPHEILERAGTTVNPK